MYKTNRIINSYLNIIIFISLLFLYVNSLSGQILEDQDTLGFELTTKLRSKHQKALNKYKQQMDIVTNRVDLAVIHNKIASIYLQSSYYIQSPKYDSVVYHTNRALILTQGDTITKAKKAYLQALAWLGTCYVNLGNKSKALDYFNKILIKTEKIQNPTEFYSHRQLATTETALIYASQDNIELAIGQYKSLLSYIEKEKIDKKNISSIVYMKLAGFYREIDSLGIATSYAKKAVEVAYFNKLNFRAAMAYLELANIELKHEAYKEVEKFLSKAFEILRDDPGYTLLLSRYYSLKSLLEDKSGNISKQVMYAQKAFELIKYRSVCKEKILVGKLLSKAYNKIGDYKKAYKILENTLAIEKRIIDKEEVRKSTLLEIQRRDNKIIFEKKQRELEVVKSQRKTVFIIMTLFLLIISLLASFFAFRDREHRIKLAVIIKEKNNQLKELDIAKSSFFANISHELRTPLTLISGPLQHLLDIGEKEFTPYAKNTLLLMGRNINKLQKLVNEILDLSKLESVRMEVEEQLVEFNLFITDVASNFDLFGFEKMNINYSYEIKLPSSLWLLIDVNKVERIIYNLLSNAFKNTKEGDRVVLSATLENNFLVVEVKDTGSGIDEVDLPHIFNRFYQGQKKKKRTLHQGTGIGLTLSKELAILMDGDLIAKSQLGIGSVFKLQIPIKDKKISTNSIQQEIEELNDKEYLSNTSVEGSNTILIVEDHSDMMCFIKGLLQDKFLLFEAQNGKDALTIVRKEKIDLVISDVMMPEMDGYELLEKLKENDSYRNIPVIMLTALNQEAYKLKALAIGVDDYLTKPFVPRELIARVSNLLSNRNYRKGLLDQNHTDVNTDNCNSISICNSVSKTEIDWLHKVKDKVITELENETFSLSQLANEMHISPRQFLRKIKKLTGLTPKKFQQEIAMQKARILLENRDYDNLRAVAYSVGVHNVTRFTKLYETKFGKKPSEYF